LRAIATRCFSPPEKLEPALADLGVEPLRQHLDERQDRRIARRPDHVLVARSGAP
jgi:hypothetical protein